MKKTIHKIGLIILGGLGAFNPSQVALACKYCDQAAAAATAAAAQPAAPAGTVVQSPGGFTPNGRQQGGQPAYTNQGGMILNRAAGSTVGNLIPGYLDSVGRGITPAQPSEKESEESPAYYVPENSLYDEVSMPIESGESSGGEISE